MNPEYDWRDDARCAQTDPDAFFPDPGGNIQSARAVCAGCPVAAQCLEYANHHLIQEGIWGGLSPAQRRRLRQWAA